MKYFFAIFTVVSLLVLPTQINASDKKKFNISEVYFIPQNKFLYKTYYKNEYIADIVAYNYSGKYLIPVSRVASILDGKVDIDYDNKIIKIKFPDLDFEAEVDIAQDKILKNGKVKDLPSGGAFIYENEAFLSAELIKDLTPIYTKTITSEQKIIFYLNDNLSKLQKGKIVKLLEQKSIDNIKQELLEKSMGSKVSLDSGEDATAATDNVSEDIDDETLILGMNINKIEMEEYLEGIKKGEAAYLPLSEISKLLDLAIEVDAKNRSAKGWFLKEGNFFELNKNELKSINQQIPLKGKDVIFTGSEIYINAETLSTLLGIDFETDFPQMMLNITSESPFPFEEKLLRERNQLKIMSQKQKKDLKIEKLETPYEAFSPPMTDVSLNFGYTKAETGSSDSSSFSVVSSGDLGYMTSSMFASGDMNQNGLSEFRIKMGRADSDRELLGAMHASEYQFGDIDSYSIPLVARSSQGRGFKVTNRDISRPDQFDSTNIIGDSTPGWQAELYRNDTLLDFQTVGSDGKYQFFNVPILYGRNIFRIVLYGPQGQVTEVFKEFNVNTSIIEKGEFTYNFSADEKSETLFGISTISKDHPGGIRSSGEFEYGLLKWLTFAGGYSHTMLQDGKHNYVTNALRANLGKAIGSLDSACDVEESGCASRLSLFSNVLGTDIRFQTAKYDNFISEEEINLTSPKTDQTILDLNRDMILPVIDQISVGFNADFSTQESGTETNIIASRLSKNIYGVNLTNLLQKDIGTTPTTNGIFSARGYISSYLVALTANYNLLEDPEVTTVDLLFQNYIDEKITNRTNITKDVSTAGPITVSNVFTYDMKGYSLSFTTNIDDVGSYFLGFGINFSFGKIPGTNEWYFQNRPMANNGVLLADAFYDKNYNRIRDEGEEYLKDPSLRINAGVAPKTDKDYVISSNVVTYQPTKVSYNMDAMKDPTLIPAVDGYEYEPRPGYVRRIDIPMFEASEIEGNIFVGSKSEPKEKDEDKKEADDEETELASTEIDEEEKKELEENADEESENEEDAPEEVELSDESDLYSLEEALENGMIVDVASNDPESIDALSKENNDYEEDEGQIPARNRMLFLVDKEGEIVNQTKSEFDGYFNFTKVLPGKYKVVAKDEEDKVISESVEIAIEKPDFYSVDDMYTKE
jgi:hypothetical protein